MFGWGNVYIGGLGSNLPGYEYNLAQAQQTIEAQRAYMNGLAQYQPTDFLSALLMANYRPPNPIPLEKRYADFCERLANAKGRLLLE